MILCTSSVEEPEKFWAAQAKNVLEWDQMFSTVSKNVKQEGRVKWFIGGKLNVSSEYIHCCGLAIIYQVFVITLILLSFSQNSYPLYRELLGPTCS